MKIEHIAMYVEDLEKAKKFFVDYFGAEAGNEYFNSKTQFRSYFLSFENGCRLEIMNKPNVRSVEPSELRTGYTHLAFSAGSREKVDSLTEKLRKDGYSVISEPRTTGDGYYESCIVDVEGNLIEITI